MTPATLATLGKIGVWLLVAGGIGILVEMVLMAVWGVALGRRLWRPYRRALRWLRHPLVLALLGSYRRRMAAR